MTATWTTSIINYTSFVYLEPIFACLYALNLQIFTKMLEWRAEEVFLEWKFTGNNKICN